MLYRVYSSGVVQLAHESRAPYVGIGSYVLVEASSEEEALRLAESIELRD